jgi:hypothetical protein
MRFHVRDSSLAGNLPNVEEWDAWLSDLSWFGTFNLLAFAFLWYMIWSVAYYLIVFKLFDSSI